MKTRGAITQLMRNGRAGYLLGKDGRIVAFDECSLRGIEPHELAIGDWVEYEELDRMEGRRAGRIQPLIHRGEE